MQNDIGIAAQSPEVDYLRGTNQGGMREANERLVLSVLRRTGNLAKADIARITGLSAQTVARLIQSMESDGLILRGEPQKGRIGQPSVPLSINPNGAIFLGMKVGRRSVEMIATNFVGEIIDQRSKLYDYPDFDTVVEFAKSASAALVGALPTELHARVGGLGIAMPFFLWNWAPLLGVAPERMDSWKTRDLHAELSATLDMPIFLQNDATAACSAELVFGEDDLPANTLGIFVAFFVGGGLVVNHQLFSGSIGNAAGLAPIAIPDRDGGFCRLIDLASLSVLEKRLQRAGHDTREMWESADEWSFPNDIVDDWVDGCAHGLSHAIHAAQTFLDLDAVLLEGWIPRAVLTDLCERVEQKMGNLDLAGVRLPELRVGMIGKNARELGAASLPLSHRFLMG